MEVQKLLRKKIKAITDKNIKLQIDICNDLADLYKQHGQCLQAIDEYKEMAALCEAKGKRIEYALAHRMIGEIYSTEMNDFRTALHHEDIYLTVAKEEKNALEEQRALATIGRTFLLAAVSEPDSIDTVKLDKAHKAFMKSLMICEKLTNISKKEQMDMRARLFLNIGIIYENQGCYEKATQYMEKSIKVCKIHDLFDQLHQSYLTLGAFNTKREDYSNALKNFDLAFDVAKRLSNKKVSMYNTLKEKSDVLIKLGEFNAAKQSLLKAYKLKTPNVEDAAYVEKTLKIVAAMCNIETTLLTTGIDEYENRKNLYEKMGDGACELRIYSKAIDYYKKTLECAEKLNLPPEELSPIYISLAMTYKDNKEYMPALDYFQKDYELCENNPVEAFKSLLQIIEIMELLNKPFEYIEKYYLKAEILAKKSEQKKLIANIVNRMIEFYRNNDSNNIVENLCKQRALIGYDSHESETDSSDNENADITNPIGADINIDEITDLSDGSDIETHQKERTARRRRRAIKIKKNAKGETQLHVACIAGNIAFVKSLLDQGHDINIRDHAGWLPIHEASSNGYTEIVELLLNNGAAINDRGGSLCEGITPLHDAAYNGHLSIIELLLERGASATSKNNAGETSLDILIKWRSKVELDPITETHYQCIFKKLKTSMDKAGLSLNTNKSTVNQNIYFPEICDENTSERHSLHIEVDENNECIGDINDIQNESSSSDSECSISPKFNKKKEKQSATIQYQQVMDDLRKRGRDLLSCKPHQNSVKLGALIDENEMEDDWLEDDLNNSRILKRRKTAMKDSEKVFTKSYRSSLTKRQKNINRSSISPVKHKQNIENCIDIDRHSSSTNRSINSISSMSPEKHKNSLDNCNVNTCNETNAFEKEIDFDESTNESISFLNSNESISKRLTFTKQKKQKSLLDIGFSRQREKTNPVIANTNSLRRLDEFNITNHNEHNVFSQSSVASYSTNLLGMNIKIENSLWKVPIPSSRLSTLTIKWLAKEAAERYYSKEGIKPTLQLQTPEGAILTDNDPVTLVLGYDQLTSTVISWNLPSITERYSDACKNMKVSEDSYIHTVLDACQATQILNLADLALISNKLLPVLKALNRQCTLYNLNLSGNCLTDGDMKVLCESLSSLKRLQSLDLSSNFITSESFEFLSEILNKSNMLMELEQLNVSFNVLGNSCLKNLINICKKIPLKSLNLSYCDISFDRLSTRRIEDCFVFEVIESINLEGNVISGNNLQTFLSYVNPVMLKNINLSTTTNEDDGIARELIEYLENNFCENLEIINISRCQVNDTEILDLIRVLQNCLKFHTLNVSYNENLTFLSLSRLLKHEASFYNLIIEGCDNITVNIESISTCFYLRSSKLKYLKITIPNKWSNTLIDMWKTCWGIQSHVKKGMLNYYEFSVINNL